MSDITKAVPRELTDAELDAVAGGQLNQGAAGVAFAEAGLIAAAVDAVANIGVTAKDVLSHNDVTVASPLIVAI